MRVEFKVGKQGTFRNLLTHRGGDISISSIQLEIEKASPDIQRFIVYNSCLKLYVAGIKYLHIPLICFSFSREKKETMSLSFFLKKPVDVLDQMPVSFDFETEAKLSNECVIKISATTSYASYESKSKEFEKLYWIFFRRLKFHNTPVDHETYHSFFSISGASESDIETNSNLGNRLSKPNKFIVKSFRVEPCLDHKEMTTFMENFSYCLKVNDGIEEKKLDVELDSQDQFDIEGNFKHTPELPERFYVYAIMDGIYKRPRL